MKTCHCLGISLLRISQATYSSMMINRRKVGELNHCAILCFQIFVRCKSLSYIPFQIIPPLLIRPSVRTLRKLFCQISSFSSHLSSSHLKVKTKKTTNRSIQKENGKWRNIADHQILKHNASIQERRRPFNAGEAGWRRNMPRWRKNMTWRTFEPLERRSYKVFTQRRMCVHGPGQKRMCRLLFFCAPIC